MNTETVDERQTAHPRGLDAAGHPWRQEVALALGVCSTIGALQDVRFVLDAFEVHAFDHLPEPVSRSRFAEMITRVCEKLEAGRAADLGGRLEGLPMTGDRSPRYPQQVMIRQGEGAVLVTVHRVDHTDAARTYVTTSVGGASRLVLPSLGASVVGPDPEPFVGIGPSRIVRLDTIEEPHPWFHGDMKVILRYGSALMWSRRSRARRSRVTRE